MTSLSSRRVSRVTAALAGIAVSALALTACAGPSGPAVAGSPTCPGGQIRMGIEPFEDPAKLVPAAEILGDAVPVVHAGNGIKAEHAMHQHNRVASIRIV